MPGWGVHRVGGAVAAVPPARGYPYGTGEMGVAVAVAWVGVLVLDDGHRFLRRWPPEPHCQQGGCQCGRPQRVTAACSRPPPPATGQVSSQLGFPSALHRIRFAHARLGHLFRCLPPQSAYNKRRDVAGPLISHVIEALARQVPTWHDSLGLIDSTPLPCAASRETVKRSALAGHAGYGYSRGHSRFF